MKKIISALLAIAMIFALCACNKTENTGGENITKLSFKNGADYDYLKTLDGQQVTISGYMATSSPADGSFMFLMNLPYQSCPFCVPNTSQLSNTMEVYPRSGKSFTYTTQAVKVVGTLEVAESEDKPFTDMYGYEFTCKIVDAYYTIIKAEDVSDEYALWEKIANSDVVTDIYAMYDYVNFVCAWNTYYVNSYEDDNGETQPGFYLYASDALNYITTDGAQWNYGYQAGYFEGIKAKIISIDKEAFSDLIANIDAAKALAEKAIAELEAGNYTSEYQYVEMFDTYDYVYSINIGDELAAEMDELYSEFSDWLGSWEM